MASGCFAFFNRLHMKFALFYGMELIIHERGVTNLFCAQQVKAVSSAVRHFGVYPKTTALKHESEWVMPVFQPPILLN